MQAWLAAPSDAALVHAADGNLAQFSGGRTAGGAFTATSGGYAADLHAFAVHYDAPAGTRAVNTARTGKAADAQLGIADGVLNVSWAGDESFSYGASFLLAPGFHSARQGWQLLLGWSSSRGPAGSTQEGGVAIDYATNLAYVVADRVSASGIVSQRVLSGPFSLPIGSWFTLQVDQTAAAQTAVYENGALVAAAAAPASAEERIDRVGYGIVQLTGGAENGSVSLRLDRAFAARYTGYVDPFLGDLYHLGRTDQGVDLCLLGGEPILAVGDGVVTGIAPEWYMGEPDVWYQLLDGPYAGRFVYVAEQIHALPRVGALLSAGQLVARYSRSGTCLETGWATADGKTLAEATTGYREGQVTSAGVEFGRFLRSLGVRGALSSRLRRSAARGPGPARRGRLDPGPIQDPIDPIARDLRLVLPRQCARGERGRSQRHRRYDSHRKCDSLMCDSLGCEPGDRKSRS